MSHSAPAVKSHSRLLQLLCLSVLLLTLGGCATNPVTGRQDFVLMSEEQEIELGAQTHKSVMQQYTEYDNPKVQALVEKLGMELAEKSHRDNLDFRFTVLDSPEVNAFATPGGYVYVTRGIMAYMNNEEQLAGVLGHEIGHVTARHSVRQHSIQKTSQTAAGLLSIAVAIVTQSNTTGQAVGQVTGQFGEVFARGYGRDNELEADRLGAEYLAEIGYDPEMMLGVVGILKDQEEFEKQRAREEGREPKIYHGVYSTHPRNDERLQEVVRAAKDFRTENPRRSNPEEFLRIMEGVTFGNSESQGVLKDQRFYHKALNVAIDFPQGWRVDNQPTQLVAVSSGRDSAMIVQLKQPGNSRTPEQFLRSNFQNLSSGESIDSDSYTGITQAKTPFGDGPVRVAAVFHGGNVLVLNGFGKSGLPDNVFFDTVRSVRNLNSDERQLASEQTIELVRVKNGVTFATLAAQSSLSGNVADQLRLLNGLFPSGEPTPGQLIKIIK